MEGAQGLIPEGGRRNHTSHHGRPSFSLDVPDGDASSYNDQASNTFGDVSDDSAPSYGARGRAPYEENSTTTFLTTELLDDDLDLDIFSDSVEESDLMEG